MYQSRKIHFIGIGGIGMSGIAEILMNIGHTITGSDIAENYNIEKLKKLGMTIFIGHKKENIGNVDLVVYSSAIKEENSEFRICLEKNIPLFKRAEMLSELMRLKKGIAIAGTHGKTTTTSLVATIFHSAGQDPTHIIGGIVPNLGNHAQVGKGDVLIAEADESDGTFLLYNPIFSVITNIDTDHLDFYQNEKNLIQAFTQFANNVPFYGACVVNLDDKFINQIRPHIKKPLVTFSLQDPSAQFFAKNLKFEQHFTTFDLYIFQKKIGEIKIFLAGEHNVMNALAAIAISYLSGLSWSSIQEGIQKFKGVKRRFETIYKKNKLEIIDDYAHHPTEILATLKAARQIKNNKLVVIFEPHRYSRTQSCWQDFLHCFNQADELFITPIYSAGEKNISDVNHERLVKDINTLHPLLAKSFDLEDCYDYFKKQLDEDVTILTLGAGSISQRVKNAIAKIK
ncbi:MAG: UDP-N-acetylmuramate--L-alanine ligase [Bacteriovoracaceae bacterium]|nr:UDP-N-acetylmuramate--L-alanine ligase [Bacteriovoracaceae bacterium]